jgi:hypothetical protein
MRAKQAATNEIKIDRSQARGGRTETSRASCNWSSIPNSSDSSGVSQPCRIEETKNFFTGTAPQRKYAPNRRAKRARSPTAKARLNAQIPLKTQVSTLQRPSRPQQSATLGVRLRPPRKTVFKERREGGRKNVQKSAKGPRENGRKATNF